MIVAAAAPTSLPVNDFLNSLNDVNNMHERRISALRNHVPIEAIVLLCAMAMVAMGFTGFQAGLTGRHRRTATLIMSTAIAVLIMMVLDLDRPYRGLIPVPVQALLDTAHSLPQ